MSLPSLTESVTEDIVKPVARDISRDPLPHVVGALVAVALVAVCTMVFTSLMGGAGTVFGLFIGLTAVLGLGVVAYALGTVGVVDLLRRTRARV